MAESKVDKVAEQEAIVAEFIEENQLLLKDPDLGPDAAQRLLEHTLYLLRDVANHLTDALNEQTKATNLLADAKRDPHCSPGKISKRDKERRRLKTEVERLDALQERMFNFRVQAQAAYDAFDENGERKEAEPQEESKPQAEVSTPELSVRPEIPRKLPWWKRLLGVHQEQAPEPRQSSVTSSRVQFDRQDYEKLLTWYEQNLEILEKAVAGSQGGEAGDWQSVSSELLENMAWCDRNMDAIEQRNADIVASELVSRREDLASRRDELNTT